MKTLIVSATYNEIRIVINKLKLVKKTESLFISDKVDILISGIGSAFTIYNLTKHLQTTNYNLIINVGIAGSYNKNIKIGDVISVKTDCFADLGIDDNGKFSTLYESKLISEKIELKFIQESFFNNIQQVKAITLNTTSGSAEIISKIKSTFNPDIETMEGASVAFVANLQKIPVIQIRAISNYVEPRNKNNWEIVLAIKNLNNLILDYFS